MFVKRCSSRATTYLIIQIYYVSISVTWLTTWLPTKIIPVSKCHQLHNHWVRLWFSFNIGESTVCDRLRWSGHGVNSAFTHELRTGNKGSKFVIRRPGSCSELYNLNSEILGGQLMNAFLFFSFEYRENRQLIKEVRLSRKFDICQLVASWSKKHLSLSGFAKEIYGNIQFNRYYTVRNFKIFI